jgi:hypothetical protein
MIGLAVDCLSQYQRFHVEKVNRRVRRKTRWNGIGIAVENWAAIDFAAVVEQHKTTSNEWDRQP